MLEMSYDCPYLFYLEIVFSRFLKNEQFISKILCNEEIFEFLVFHKI